MLDDWVVGDAIARSDPNNKSEANRNRFSEAIAEQFVLRGPNYLEDSRKEPSKPSAFAVAGVNVFRTETEVFHAAKSVNSLKKFISDRPNEEFFIFSWILPGPPYHTVVELFRRSILEGEDPAFDLAFSRFKTEGSEYRKSRFKFLCQMVEAPWAMKMSVASLAGQRPVIICNKLEAQHFSGANYTEINISVASSTVACMLNSLFLSAGSRAIVDLACTIEGQTSEELPERMLAAVRWHYCAIDEIACVLGPNGDVTALHVSAASNLRQSESETESTSTLRDPEEK